MQSIFARALSIVFAVVAVCTTQAWATLTPMTGGDAGAGLTLNSSDVALAVNVGHLGPYFIGGPAIAPAPYVLQGVTFQDMTSAVDGDQLSIVSLGGGSGDFGGVINLVGNSTNDIAAENILSNGYFAGAGFDVTISGLLPSTEYKLELLLSVTSFGSRSQEVTFGGVTDAVSLATSLAYVDTFQVISNAAGEVSGTFRNPGNDGPVLNAIVLTLPEPSSLVFTVIGGALLSCRLLLRRRTVFYKND